MSDAIEKVFIAGAGQMGPGIAMSVALAGCHTWMTDIVPASLTEGVKKFNENLNFLVEHEVITPAEADTARSRLLPVPDLSLAAQADLLIECIVERLPVKQEFFKHVDEICPLSTILASNTSGLRISDIAALMKHPERAVTTHFWNPGHLMPLVEVIQGEKTSDETVERVYSFLKLCGKQPVIGRKDTPGQICNRLFQAVIREAVYIVQSGIASVQDVETAVKCGMGIRFPVYGPLEHLDVVGLDLGLAVQSTVLPDLCNSTEAGDYIRELVAKGDLGVKTGRGFYDWSRRSVDQLKQERDLFLVERLKATRKVM